MAINSVSELFNKFNSNRLELPALQKRQMEMTRNPNFFMFNTDYKNSPEKIKLRISIEQRLVRLAKCLNTYMETHPEKFSELEKEQIKTVLAIDKAVLAIAKAKNSVSKELPSEGSSFTLQL